MACSNRFAGLISVCYHGRALPCVEVAVHESDPSEMQRPGIMAMTDEGHILVRNRTGTSDRAHSFS